ncbi:MAG: hypothetical protein RRA32_09825 [bacterium]|nr:hypothetical protein [bacterium]
MSLSRQTTLFLLAAFLVAAGCGYNPKGSGSGLPALPEKGTVECLYAGCHDSITATTGSFPGFIPAISWALGFHGDVDAVSASITDDCSGCHDPIDDIPDYPFLFTSTSSGIIADSVHGALGLTFKPLVGCEACHGSGMEHYAYIDTTLYYGEHREPMDSTISPSMVNPYHLLSCGPCHSPSQHAGGASLDDFLANQYPEWRGGDGPGIFFEDGHSDSLVVETTHGTMTSVVRGTPCAACHTVEGFFTWFVSGDLSWASSQTVIDRLVAETGDTDVNNPSNLPGSAALAQVSCVTCHPSHEPGVLIRSVTLGLTSDTQRNAALCIACHNVKELTADAGSGQSHVSSLEIPRHPQKEVSQGFAATANDGLRGVEFVGYTFNDSGHAGTAIAAGCVGCHYHLAGEANLTELPTKATSGHTFRPRLENCLADFAGCHDISEFYLADGSQMTSYVESTISTFNFGSIYYSGSAHTGVDYDRDGNVEPLQSEISGMLADLKQSLTDITVPFDQQQGLFDLTQMASRTTTERAAAYNYDFVVGDGSYGYHNPIYCVNLLAASISVLSVP